MSVNAASAVNGIQSTIVSSDTTIRQTVQQQQTLFDTIQELATDNDTKNITSAASNNDTLEGKLNTVWDKMDSLTAEVNDLNAEIKSLNSVIRDAQAEKTAAQNALNNLNQQLEQEQGKLSAENRAKRNNQTELSNAQAEKLEKEQALEAAEGDAERINTSISEKQAEYDSIMAKIDNITSQFNAEEQARKNNLILQCMSEYNEEEDGDYDEYLNNRLSEELGSSNCDSLIGGLQSYSSGLIGDCADLRLSLTNTNNNIAAYRSSISSLGTTINSLERRIATNESNITTYSGNIRNINAQIEDQTTIINNADDIIEYAQETINANNARIDVIKNVEYPQEAAKIQEIVLSQVSAAERQIAIDNGLDLTEKMPDGSAKYLIAKGANDGQYHIYQRSTSIDLSKYEVNLKNTKGPQEKATDYFAIDIARIYTPNGYGICALYNGYMCKNFKETSNGNTVYYLEDTPQYGDGTCGLSCSKNSYSTCSPLTFDLNGDGVQTSTSVIDFDIDGDGVVDKINDVNDAVLCFDKDGDGISGEDGSECFGNNTDFDGDGKADGFKDGFAALKFIAMNLGLINGKDDMVLDENDLATLEQEYGLKMKANGYNSEAQSLSALGISQINLANTDNTFSTDNFDGQGNMLMRQVGATFVQNGVEKEYADVWHEKKSFIA